MKKEKVFISHGDIMVDHIYNDSLELIRKDGGGCNWNDLYHLAHMGENCYAIGSRGNDKDGELAVTSLEKVGVNTHYISVENRPTSIMNIIIPDTALGDDTVIHSWYSPITNELTMKFSQNLPKQLPKELEEKECYLILDKFLPINLAFLESNPFFHVCLDVRTYSLYRTLYKTVSYYFLW